MTPMAISSVPDIVLVLPYARQWQGQNQASRAAGGLAIGEFKVTRIKDGKSVCRSASIGRPPSSGSRSTVTPRRDRAGARFRALSPDGVASRFLGIICVSSAMLSTPIRKYPLCGVINHLLAAPFCKADFLDCASPSVETACPKTFRRWCSITGRADSCESCQ